MNNNDPFADMYYQPQIAKPKPQMQPNQQVQLPQEKDPFADMIYEKKEKQRFKPKLTHEPETSIKETISNIPRHATRIASRVGEAAVGLPGDILTGVPTLLSHGAEFVTGGDYSGYREKVRKNVKEEMGLPTSGELKEKSESLTKGFTKPQGKGEEFFDNLVQDLTGSALTGGASTAKSAIRQTANFLGGEIAKATAGGLGSSESAQEKVKIGAQFLISLISKKDKFGKTGADRHIAEKYRINDKKIDPSATANARVMETKLINLQDELMRGGSAPSKTPVLIKIEEILKKINSRGEIAVKELPAFRRDINEVAGDWLTKKGAKKLLGSVNHEVDQTMQKWGSVHDPKFLKEYNDINKAYGVLQESKKVSNTVKDVAKSMGKMKIPSILGAFGTAAYHSVPGALLGSVGAAGTYAGIKGVELAYRFVKNPTLRKYYIDTMNHAMKGNHASTARSLRKLDDAVAKEEQKSTQKSKYKVPKKS